MGERGAVATGGATVGTAAESDKTPRTERGRRTLRAILDAAAAEFGTRGFHETSIVGITSRAGVALGSFYTYFSSKDELFRALVRDMSTQVGIVGAAASQGATSVLDGERAVLASFIGFAREHRELYRIIDESEFVDPASYRAHYENAASRIGARLKQGATTGELRDGIGEVEAWAIMGMNVFLGLRYGVMADGADLDAVAGAANALLRDGLAR
ncbi:TetR/AcrR family transcriptional regulator [Sphingomonas sp. SUN039]|uniref:TetR/AcrR family transcriptional regulator n=1 Tax=Sphingomonas sp. SUN039 TaxID=2937787 RepID=UPI0021644265|nr:TetR/AcrR family transcriptional regulator [Sphingomonas sp. SUN039]UVO55163.1 TetR/AcrR family transcriptional regulator [Sphingomonas sp. SUN039]